MWLLERLKQNKMFNSASWGFGSSSSSSCCRLLVCQQTLMWEKQQESVEQCLHVGMTSDVFQLLLTKSNLHVCAMAALTTVSVPAGVEAFVSAPVVAIKHSPSSGPVWELQPFQWQASSFSWMRYQTNGWLKLHWVQFPVKSGSGDEVTSANRLHITKRSVRLLSPPSSSLSFWSPRAAVVCNMSS